MKRVRNHFSLLELIICLGILAVLASILLDNFADVKARECERITQERGNHVREIVKGSRTENGISAFLSDMGRFPCVYIPSEGDGSGGRRLAELYDPSIWYHNKDSGKTALQQVKTISAADIQSICQGVSGSTFPVDGSGINLPYPEISMVVGWNGPYINMATPIKGNFYDGWGNPWNIVSNYNLRVNNHRLEENHSSTNSIKIYATESEVNALVGKTADERRIDGIVSYGANNADDSGVTDVAAADVDQKFVFPHNMDNYGSENLATLTILLKVRDQESGKWVNMLPITTYQDSATYTNGQFVVKDGEMYCYNSNVSTTWQSMSSVKSYNATYHSGSGFLPEGVCIYQDAYYLRKNATVETEFTPANWIRLAGVGEVPDNISLFLFTPVMQETSGERYMDLGFYHFYRNKLSKNSFGVKPTDASETEDVDCAGGVDANTSALYDYNSRYLIAEDHLNTSWNEFLIKRLIPGQRKIFCIMYNGTAKSCYQSEVDGVTLKPGNNVVTLYLERKL